MGRWRAGARERLERAALELFTEQGFAATTVPEITARAGLTTRTFFRHFADKREVLFAGEGDLPTVVAGALTAAPPGLGPMDVVAHGLRTVMAPLFADRRDQLLARRAVIEQDDGLRERDLRKLADLAEVIGHGLRARGVEEPAAMLTGRLAVTVFDVAVTRWLESGGEPDLVAVVDETLEALGAVVGAATGVPGRSTGPSGRG